MTTYNNGIDPYDFAAVESASSKIGYYGTRLVHVDTVHGLQQNCLARAACANPELPHFMYATDAKKFLAEHAKTNSYAPLTDVQLRIHETLNPVFQYTPKLGILSTDFEEIFENLIDDAQMKPEYLAALAAFDIKFPNASYDTKIEYLIYSTFAVDRVLNFRADQCARYAPHADPRFQDLLSLSSLCADRSYGSKNCSRADIDKNFAKFLAKRSS